MEKEGNSVDFNSTVKKRIDKEKKKLNKKNNTMIINDCNTFPIIQATYVSSSY